MPGGYKNIKGKDGVNGFKKGQSGNPWGRPPRLVGQILKDVKDDGMEAVTASQVSDVISVLLNYSVEQVKAIASDKTLPILIQRTARRFAGSSDKDWDWVLSNNLDRAHGKAKQSVEHTGKNGEAIKMDFSKLSTDELREMAKMRKKAISNGDTERSPTNGR